MDEEFYFKQEAGRLLLSPADETPVPPGDAWPEDLDVALAVERLEAACDLAVERVEAACDLAVERVGHRWAGLRPFFRDRSPAIGPDALLPQFFWCAGLGGYGVQTAMGAATCLGALLRGTALPQAVALSGRRA
jgi:D-arginine dehydrogenase